MSDLDPATLRAMAIHLDTVADEALNRRHPSPEQRAVAAFASGLAARCRTVAIQTQQERAVADLVAKRQRDAALQRAMRERTLELPVVVPYDQRPARFKDLGFSSVEIVPRSWVTGRPGTRYDDEPRP